MVPSIESRRTFISDAIENSPIIPGDDPGSYDGPQLFECTKEQLTDQVIKLKIALQLSLEVIDQMHSFAKMADAQNNPPF
jgi:hypothetical protein